MATVPVGETVALVDDADRAIVSPYKWEVARRRGAMYARMRYRQNGRQVHVAMHRLILGVLPEIHVDHVNGDTLDNRRCNLRVATRRENSANSVCRSGSGYKGAYPVTGKPQWFAAVTVARKTIYLGCYGTREEAARAYDEAARRYFGKFARVNFPLSGEQPARRPA